MKKLFLILAASVVLFACGGNSNKGGNSGTMTVEEKAKAYVQKMENASSETEAMNIMKNEMLPWYESLSVADQAKVDAVMEGDYSDSDYYYDEECYDEECYDEEYYDDEDYDEEW